MWSHLWLSGYYIIVIVCAHIKLICYAEGFLEKSRFGSYACAITDGSGSWDLGM